MTYKVIKTIFDCQQGSTIDQDLWDAYYTSCGEDRTIMAEYFSPVYSRIHDHLANLKANHERLNPSKSKQEIAYVKKLRELIEEIEALLAANRAEPTELF